MGFLRVATYIVVSFFSQTTSRWFKFAELVCSHLWCSIGQTPNCWVHPPLGAAISVPNACDNFEKHPFLHIFAEMSRVITEMFVGESVTRAWKSRLLVSHRPARSRSQDPNQWAATEGCFVFPGSKHFGQVGHGWPLALRGSDFIYLTICFAECTTDNSSEVHWLRCISVRNLLFNKNLSTWSELSNATTITQTQRRERFHYQSSRPHTFTWLLVTSLLQKPG